MWRQWLFISQFGYSIRIFLNERELVRGYLISIWDNSLSFVYDFQRHKQEVTQVKLILLVLQSKLKHLLIWLTDFVCPGNFLIVISVFNFNTGYLQWFLSPPKIP